MSLTQTDIDAAHDLARRHRPSGWIACFHPERVMNLRTVFVGECPRCRIATRAYLAISGDRTGTNTEGNGSLRFVELSRWIEEMEERFG